MKKLFIIAGILLSIISCRTAQDHYRLFEKKGGKIEPVEKEVKVPVIVPGKDGEDSLIYVDIFVPCPEVTAPKTNSQVRQENRTERVRLRQLTKQFNDSLSAVKKMHKKELKYAIKNARIEARKDAKISKYENKTERTKTRQENKSRWYVWLLAGMLLMLILQILYKNLKPRFLNTPIK